MTFMILAFLSGTLLALGLLSLAQRSPARRRLARLDGGAVTTESDSLADQLEKLLEPLAKRAGGATDVTRQRLIQAGFRTDSALTLYMGGRLALPLVLLAIWMVVSSVFGFEGLRHMAGLMMAAVAGYVGPSFYVDRSLKKRRTAIRLGLPDALDLLVVCLEAGLSLGAAFNRVAREFTRTSPPLCEELRLVTLEMQAGKSGADALRSFANRVGTPDVGALAAMLIQTERFGTSVTDALRVHCEGMRKDRLQKAEEAAQKAAVKMIIPAAIFIFPATMLVLVGPTILKMGEIFAR
jgi:tight adherence protein C